jgi:hypothetical protein
MALLCASSRLEVNERREAVFHTTRPLVFRNVPSGNRNPNTRRPGRPMALTKHSLPTHRVILRPLLSFSSIARISPAGTLAAPCS